MDENKKTTKKSTNIKKETQSKQQLNKAEQEYKETITKAVENMSPINKLFTIREAIDMLLVGKHIDINVINMCFNDLCEDLADLKSAQNELDAYTDLYAQMLQGIPINEANPKSKNEDYDNTLEPEDYLYNVCGDKYPEFLDEIDRLNIEDKTLLQVYLYPSNRTHTVKMKIMDTKKGVLKRVYTDPWDFMLNYKNDIAHKFNCKKLHDFGRIKKLSDNKEENIEE